MSDPVLLAGLTGWEWAFCGSAAFVAGCVRGFAGFGLSAVAMACLVLILPPVELIPIFYVLEAAASLAMFRGGIRDADMSHVWPLAIGSFVGVPVGLLATTTISPDISRLVAVAVILSLTILQFFRSMPAVLTSTPGRYVVGTTAGIVTGLTWKQRQSCHSRRPQHQSQWALLAPSPRRTRVAGSSNRSRSPHCA